jgi:L(+)-tartrate dehydratase alpha subunit
MDEIEECPALKRVKKANIIAPLRHKAVEIFDEKNTGTMSAPNSVELDWELVHNSSEVQKYTLYGRRGACAGSGSAKGLLMSLEGYEGVV